MNLLSSHDKDFTAKYFRHEIYAGDSDACGSKDFSDTLTKQGILINKNWI